jgi:hypothetical protein
MTFTFAEPTELILEIPPSLQAQYWQQSQGYATPSSRWCAYINQICLNTFLDWVKTEYVPEATALPDFWDVVNGSAIAVGEKRVVLIPSEAIDSSEIEVPQEWVDIPSWAADYYLAVQVNPDGDWVRVWGYTTHQELKSRGSYDPVDRTYCMDAKHLTLDLNAFWITYQFCPEETTKLALNPLPELSATQAENLLQRLGNSDITFPRLAVPFSMWGVLLSNKQWQQRLYQQRSVSPQANLSQWLQEIYTSGWLAIETLMGLNSSNLAWNFRSASGTLEPSIKRAKLIDLGVQIASQSIVLLVALIPEANRQVGVCVQLHPMGEVYLPANIKLTLLSSGEILGEVQARRQDNYIQLPRFDVETGESFNIQIALDNFQITENFVI